MEALRKKILDLPLRIFFILSVLTTVCVGAVLSGLTIWGCTAFRHYLLPDSNAVYLTVETTLADGTTSKGTFLVEIGEDMQNLPQLISNSNSEMIDAKYAVQKIEKSFDTLTPKRKIAYQVCGAAMVVIPALIFVVGILICGFYFYKRKLSEPLRLLSAATGQIAEQNLDFSIKYDSMDEMGLLCRSFEQMREALVQNNKELWALLEQRRLLQASIAHDLRNPIAIIEGYTEYLRLNLSSGKLSTGKLERIINNLNMAAKRLEHYTESVRTLNQLEDMEIARRPVTSAKLIENICDDFKIMADNAGISLSINSSLPECELQVDSAVFYRILENLYGNALRFAKNRICINFELEGDRLHVTITNDGSGFPSSVLNKREALFLPTGQEGGHLGMGLAISRLLCEKHGGTLKFFNNDCNNAVVEIMLAV